jgi:addiction module HigA family antidote
MLLEDFLVPMGLTQRELADGIRVPYQRINELVNGRRGITPATALRLAKFFGTSPDVWMNLQLRWDLYHAREAEASVLARIGQVQAGLRAAG